MAWSRWTWARRVLRRPTFRSSAEAEAPTYALKVGQHVLDIAVLSMGNPHAVLRVNDLDSAPVDILGAAIESHARFPQRVNAGFMQVLTPHDIRLRVYERGAGETLACGTGACAAAVAGIRQGLAEKPGQRSHARRRSGHRVGGQGPAGHHDRAG